MRRAYQKPCAKKVNFNFEKVLAASGKCEWTIKLRQDETVYQCHSMTPNDPSPIKAASLTSEPCGYYFNQG